MKSYSTPVLAVIVVISLTANVLLYFRYSSNRPLVTVGSTVITKKQFQDQLEHDSGQAVLSKMVFDALVAQAAARSGLTPTAQDVDDRIADIQRRSPQTLAPYVQDPVKLAQFRQDLSTSIALENIRIQDVALTPAEVTAFYNQHQAEIALPQQVTTTIVVTQNSIDAATATDLLRENDPPDVLGRQPRLHVVGQNGYQPDLQALPAPLKSQVSSFVTHSKSGDIKTFRSGAFFLTLRVNNNAHNAVPPLNEIRGKVERMARLDHAPSQAEELARLYQAAHPTFSVDKYADYFAAVQQYPINADNSKKTASTH